MGATMNKLKGKAKKVEGKMTGDRVRTAQGAAEEKVGSVQMKAKRAMRKVKAGAKRIVNKVAAKVQRGAARARSRSR